MSAFDVMDIERRPPSSDTPLCAVCGEAGLPRYGGYCFRHDDLAGPDEEGAVPFGKGRSRRADRED